MTLGSSFIMFSQILTCDISIIFYCLMVASTAHLEHMNYYLFYSIYTIYLA